MNSDSYGFLSELVNSHSPSGTEKESALVWKKIVGKTCEDVRVDVHGNVIGVMHKKGSPRVMLAAHIDEIGYMVKFIDKEGYLYFSTIGGVDPHLIPGQRILIKGRKGDVPGIIGRKPIHLQESDEAKKVAAIKDLWIDIGAKNKKEAEKAVSVGDPAIPAVGFGELMGKRIVGRGFDNRAGAFVVAESLRLMDRKKLKASVHAVATVQEELGLRGARTSTYGISPDIGIAVDVAFATDFPGADKRTVGDIKIGAGPVITRGPNINSKLFDLMVKTAENAKIPYQVQAASRGTGTDANVMQLTRSGVVTGLIGIPNRYMHTQVELVDTSDLDNAARLVARVVEKLDGRTDFVPY